MTDFTSLSDADLDRFIAEQMESELPPGPIPESVKDGTLSPKGFWFVASRYEDGIVLRWWHPRPISTDRNATYAAWMALGVSKQDWIPHSLEPATSNFTVGFLVAMSAPTRQLAEWIAAALEEK